MINHKPRVTILSLNLYRLKKKNFLFYCGLAGCDVLATISMVPLQVALTRALNFSTWMTVLYLLISIYSMILSLTWPLLFNAKFFPNFAMEYIECSFKAWIDDIHDPSTDIGSRLDIGLQLMDLTKKYDMAIGPTISISFTCDILKAVICSYSFTSIAFTIGDATYLNYAWSAYNELFAIAHCADLIWTYERGHKLQRMIQKSRIQLEDACYKR